MSEQATQKKTIGEGVEFERIRRITGYLVGTVDRFNDAKRAEESDRVKHSLSGTPMSHISKGHGRDVV